MVQGLGCRVGDAGFTSGNSLKGEDGLGPDDPEADDPIGRENLWGQPFQGGGWRVEGGGWRVEGGGWRVEGGGWRVKGGGWRGEGGGWRVEFGGNRFGQFDSDLGFKVRV